MRRPIKNIATGFKLKNWFKKTFGFTAAAALATGSATAGEITIDDLVPEWKPTIERSLDKISERCHYYLNHSVTLVVFEHGTCVIVSDEKSEADSFLEAIEELSGFLKAHPDVTPMEMKDGNLLVRIPHLSVFTVVLKETMDQHGELIKENHMRAIPDHEVLITPSGPNVFDQNGMNLLFGRSFVFWDAQELKPWKIMRAKKD